MSQALKHFLKRRVHARYSHRLDTPQDRRRSEFYAEWDPRNVLPMAYIIDADGVVAWQEAGGAGGLAEMEEQVVLLLEP